MGFRFRKSIKLGGLRVNLSKSGIGYSVGGKGYRYTKKAGGGTRTTLSIPGTGISHVSESSGPKAGTPHRAASTDTKEGMNVKKSKKNGKLGPILAVLLCILALVSCFGGSDEEATAAPTEPSKTLMQSEPTAPTEATELPTEAQTDAPTAPPTEPPTEAPTEPLTEAPKDPPETEPEGITYVLNTNTHKFHYQSCSSVDDMKESNKSTYTGTRDEVIDMGYEPCGRCDP